MLHAPLHAQHQRAQHEGQQPGKFPFHARSLIRTVSPLESVRLVRDSKKLLGFIVLEPGSMRVVSSWSGPQLDTRASSSFVDTFARTSYSSSGQKLLFLSGTAAFAFSNEDALRALIKALADASRSPDAFEVAFVHGRAL